MLPLILIATLLLTWKDNSSEETGFNIYRSDCNPQGMNCSAYRVIFTTAPNTERFYDTTTRRPRVYCYFVSSILPEKEYPSNEDCAKDP